VSSSPPPEWRAAGGAVDYRASQTNDGAGSPVQTWTAYDGPNAYADFDSAGQPTARYLHGPAVDELLARTDAGTGQTLWYLKDVRGSTRLLADLALLDLVDAIAYDAYGNVLSETAPSVGGRFKYTGREYDAATGLYDYHNRWYDPKAGVFVEQDPLGFAAGDANLSRYVGNAPTIYTDPLGLVQQDPGDDDPLPGVDDPDIRGYYFNALDEQQQKEFRDALQVALDEGIPASQAAAMVWEWSFERHVRPKFPAPPEELPALPPEEPRRSVFSDDWHSSLDLAGLADPTGAADALNGWSYLLEGNLWEAGISFAAMLPWGDGMKALRRTGKAVAGAGEQGIEKGLKRVRPANPVSRPFADRLRDFESDPSRWSIESIHSEVATGAKTRGGVSEQIIYRNKETGEILVRHRVTDAKGRVRDDHFRPYYKPRFDPKRGSEVD
jgi:RHS repeat-associated protein